MFYSVSGNVVDYSTNFVAVESGGVAFLCFTSMQTASKCSIIGEKVTLFTYLNVREDAIELYGFYDKEELDCFKMLINVSGVGAKMALSLLSEYTPDKIILSIAAGDYKALTKAVGIGAKLAQRITLELKDKIGALSVSTQEEVAAVSSVSKNSVTAEAVAALVMLGYNQSEASLAVSNLDPALSVEELIKQALKLLSK
ncbi:MAG: Holliday junction branch migration protein RuvA [Oscillospiraceae bacterium]|nr:Holliday junction branch migration protein RuvA [Oscillospiraceae bacterium]